MIFEEARNRTVPLNAPQFQGGDEDRGPTCHVERPGNQTFIRLPDATDCVGLVYQNALPGNKPRFVRGYTAQ
jgi:hypothetical protein